MSSHILLLDFDSVVDTSSEQILRARAYLASIRRQKKKFPDNGDADPALAFLTKKLAVGEIFDYEISSSEEVLFERYLKESLWLVRGPFELLILAIIVLDCTVNGDVFNGFADNLAEIGAKWQDIKTKLNGGFLESNRDYLSAIDDELLMQHGIESLCDLCSIYPQVLPLFKTFDSKRAESSCSPIRPIICSYRNISQVKSILYYHLQLGSEDLNGCQLFSGTIQEQLEIIATQEQVSQISVLVDDISELSRLQKKFKDSRQVQIYYTSWGKGKTRMSDLEHYQITIANQDPELSSDSAFITTVANLL